MPDINATIRLNMIGSEKVANDLSRVKSGFEDVAKSAQGISASTGGGDDPFQQAMGGGRTAAFDDTNDTAARQDRNSQEQAKAQNREDRSRNMFQSGGGRLLDPISHTAGKVQSGNLGGAAASMLGPVGIAGAIGLGVFSQFDAATQREGQRVEQTYGSGLSQRMGMSYSDARNLMIDTRRQGYSDSAVQGLMQAATMSGGFRQESMTGSLNLVQGMGIDASIAGQAMGASTRAGLRGNALISLAGMGQAGAGRADTGNFIAMMTRALEGAAERGVAKGMIDEGVLREWGGVAQSLSLGGMQFPAVQRAMETSMHRGAGAAQLNSMEDLVALQALRQNPAFADMSLTELRRQMETNPAAVNRAMAQHITATSGDHDVAVERFREYLGGDTSVGMAEDLLLAYAKSLEAGQEAQENWSTSRDEFAEKTIETSAKLELALEDIDKTFTEIRNGFVDAAGKVRDLLLGDEDIQAVRAAPQYEIRGALGRMSQGGAAAGMALQSRLGSEGVALLQAAGVDGYLESKGITPERLEELIRSSDTDGNQGLGSINELVALRDAIVAELTLLRVSMTSVYEELIPTEPVAPVGPRRYR